MNHPEIFEKDLASIAAQFKESIHLLAEKSILVTGATGLIGFNLLSALLKIEDENALGMKITAVIRNEEKAQNLFGNKFNRIRFVVSDIRKKIHIDSPIDYIVHAANQTSSKAFVSEPVETIRTAIDGTINMLELAREKQVSSFVFLSTMEVYGMPHTDEKISETHSTDLNTMSVRTCYPESKRLCESLCSSYAYEYGISTKVLRLTQTFGPGVDYNDGRVFADFARCAIEKRNIILHTKGETKRNYLYTADAVSAILFVLLKGKSGEAYNAANESTYCSISEMANVVAKHCAGGDIQVEIQEADLIQFGYAPTLHMNLDTSKLRALGWSPTQDLSSMFDRLIQTMA